MPSLSLSQSAAHIKSLERPWEWKILRELQFLNKSHNYQFGKQDMPGGEEECGDFRLGGEQEGYNRKEARI